jgi:hypothetical protein
MGLIHCTRFEPSVGRIAGFLDFRSLCRMQCVSAEFAAVAADPLLWQELQVKRFGTSALLPLR